METEGKTKGVGFVNVKSFVLERWGAPGWAAVLERLPTEDRLELQSVIAVGWYSLALYARLIRLVDSTHGLGDLKLLSELGTFEAQHDLTTIHRVFLRLANPSFAIGMMGEYWGRFHDTGTWTIERGRDRVLASLDGWALVDEALCVELTAYFKRTLELVGAKHVVVEHPRCRAHGSAQCVFTGRWGGLSESS